MMPCFRKIFLFIHLALAGCCSAGEGQVGDRKSEVGNKKEEGGGAAAKQTGRKLALLVGCTEYPNLKNILNPLEGPANDVVLMRKVLKQFGFADEDMVTLAEKSVGANLKPTRQNIQREFEKLAGIAREGDQIVILLSGHGSQQPDRQPFEKAGGLNQIFLPADAAPWLADKKTVANAIVDHELGQWSGAIIARKASLWVIVDSCHSGTMLRGDSPEVAREVPADRLIPADVVDKAIKYAAERNKKGWVAPPAWMENAPGLVALYASQSTELTVERKPYDGTSNDFYGLLTYTLCKILETAGSRSMTYQELTQRIHAEYIHRGRTGGPTPLVEGLGADREVLGMKSWPNRSRFVLSRSTDAKDGWKMSGGQLNGLTEKSILAVYPPAGAAEEKGAAGKPVGHVVIKTCHVTEADVVACDHAGMKATAKLPVGGRCVPVRIDFGSLQLSVAVDGMGDDARALHKQLLELAGEAGSLISLPADAKQAEWLFQIDKGKAILSPAQAVWAKTNSGQPLQRFGPYALDEPARIKGALEQIARVRNLLRLTSASSQEAMCGQSAQGDDAALNVELTLLKLKSKDDAAGTPIAWKERGTVLNSGDWVAFRVKNGSRFAVDVSLLFVSSSYKIRPIFPKPGIASDNRLQPGQAYRTGAFPITADTLGLEHLALIAVRGEGQQLDFTCLAQPTLELARSRGDANKNLDSPLGELLKRGLYGEGQTRDIGAEQIPNHALRLLSWYVEPESKSGKQ